MSHGVQTEKPNISSSAAMWAVLIFVGLIIAAINFVQAESKGEEHGHGAATEHHEAGAGHEAAGGHESHEATAESNHATGTPAATHDSAEHGAHPEAPAAEPAHEEAHH